MRPQLIVALALVAGCGGGEAAPPDLAAAPPVDLASIDESAAVDLAVEDQAVPDLASSPDLTGVDLGPVVGGVQVSATGSTTLTLAGAQVQLDAVAVDLDGGVLTGEAFAWSSDAPGVAAVSAAGKVTAIGNGTAVIRATAGPNAASGTITITVAIAVSSVTVAPATLIVPDGKSATLTATARDSASNPFGGVSFAWTSADPTHAAVSGTGSVTAALAGALGAGPIDVTASAGGQSGTSAVSVAVYPTWTFATGGAGVTVDVDQNQHVVFKNTDGATHSVVLDAGGTLVGNFGNGDSAAAHVTLAPGSYAFHCGIHGSAMTGTLVVH